jgi:hypothetical protein
MGGGCGGGLDSEDGDLRGDPVELFERGAAVDTDMWARPGREHQIATQDR